MAATVAALVGTISPAELPPVTSALALIPGHDEFVSRLFGVNALRPLRTLPFLWETLRAVGTTDRARLGPTGLRSLVAPRVERYLRERQNPSGGIAGVPLFTMLGLQCLQFCGVTEEDQAIRRGLEYVRRVYHETPHGLEIEPFESAYWDTAHMVRVLAQLPFERHRVAARRGAQWLVRGQSNASSPHDWQRAPQGVTKIRFMPDVAPPP